MGRPRERWMAGRKTAAAMVRVFVVVVGVFAGASVSSEATIYSKNFYQPQVHYQQQPVTLSNTSGAVFEPRDGGANSFGGSEGGYSGGGGGGAGGGYGAPAMANPTMYKYQIYPDPAVMAMASGGWGMDDEDDDDGGGFDFPKELIGLLGLKGLKGKKGLKGVLGLLKGLLLLKKLLGIPLLPILLPILLPVLLLKLAKLLIPLALLLLLPVILFTIPAPAGKNFEDNFHEKLNVLMANLPEDLSQIVAKIKEKTADMSLNELFTGTKTESVGSARGPNSSWGKGSGQGGKSKNSFGETGSRRTKVVYAASANSANIKPSIKSIKLDKTANVTSQV